MSRHASSSGIVPHYEEDDVPEIFPPKHPSHEEIEMEIFTRELVIEKGALFVISPGYDTLQEDIRMAMDSCFSKEYEKIQIRRLPFEVRLEMGILESEKSYRLEKGKQTLP